MRTAPALFDLKDPYVAAVERVERTVTGQGGPRPLEQYQDRPVDFAVDVLGIPERTIRWSANAGYEQHRWDGTRDPIARMVEALAEGRNVGVESGTGTGKSYALAWIALWFLACWRDARVYTYAPKEDQLRLFMWAEIAKMWPRFHQKFPTASLTDLRIRMDGRSDRWSMHGYSVQVKAGEESATGAQGAHAPHMLLITEETPGIHPSVMKALENTRTDDHNLQISVGNPDHQLDELHRWCEKPTVEHIRVSALDHPNVVTGRPIIPGAVSRNRVEERLEEYGEGSRLADSRIRGISPSEAADSLIRLDWVRTAVALYDDLTFREGLPARGVDVANSEDGDLAAIARGLGACLLEVDSFPCPDASQLGVRVAAEIALERIDSQHVGVDAVGVGASTVNKLKELGRLVQALNGGERARPALDEDVLREKGKGVRREESYYNLRAQMWWQMRQDLHHGRIALPDDPELHRDLITPRWETRNGKIIVESKEDIRKRLGRSPDKGDAAVMWNWVRHRRALPEDDGPPSAWAPEILKHEARENRRVRERPARRPAIDPSIMETVD